MLKDNKPASDHTEASKEGYGVEPIQLESSELLIYTPPHITARHRPAVTLGRMKHGELVFHFRTYKRSGRARHRITADGATFKPKELFEILARIAEIADALPELALALKEGEGLC